MKPRLLAVLFNRPVRARNGHRGFTNQSSLHPAGTGAPSRRPLWLLGTLAVTAVAVLAFAAPFAAAAPNEAPEVRPATEVTSTSAVLHAVLAPNQALGEEGFYVFFLGQAASCEEDTPATGFIADHGLLAEAVEAAVSVLPAQRYSFCVATTNGTEGEVRFSEPGFFETPAGPPAVVGASFSQVGTSTATVGAEVTSNGLPTGYFVEYVTEAQFQSAGFAEAARAPAGPVELSGTAAGPVHLTLSGLAPATIYRFRFQAQNEVGSTTGPEGRFATAPPSGPLPDGRAAELVSTAGDFGEPYVPVTPIGQLQLGLNSTRYIFQAAEDGEAVTYVGEPPATGGQGQTGGGLGDQWLARRTAQGWQTTGIDPAEAGPYQAFSPNLSDGFLAGTTNPLTPDVPDHCRSLYSRSTATGAYSALFNLDQAPAESGEPTRPCGHPLFAGASRDGSQVIFQSEAALTEDPVEAVIATESPPSADESERGHPGDTGDTSKPCWFGCNLYEAVGGHLRLVNVLESHPVPNASFGGYSSETTTNRQSSDYGDLSNAISEDGSRIFWTDTQPGPDFEHVYVLKDGTTNVQVSGPGPGRYWTATPNGRYAFYTEAGALWKFDTDEDTREEISGEGFAGVLGVIGTDQTSDEAQYVYFVAEGVLAGNSNSEGETPSEGSPNLYLVHGGTTTFIATLSGGDDQAELTGVDNGIYGGDWKGALGLRTAAVSPDGTHLVFESSRSLTGYANGSVREAYVYSAADRQLLCASCDPRGLAPSVSESRGGAGFEPRLPPSTSSGVYLKRWMSANGNRVFFDSEQPLVPEDTNAVDDVYEWERQGEGTCTPQLASPLTHGCTFLLSGGGDSGYSFLVDADKEGKNVFLEHTGPLGQVKAPATTNELYDLRVGGGFEETTAPACSGEGCRGALPAPPSVQSAGTAGFQADEPPPPTKCKKGSVERHGKCVARKHKKGHKKHGKKSHGRAAGHKGGGGK